MGAASYADRLAKVEAALAPVVNWHLIPVYDGQTRDEAKAAYAAVRGITLAEVRGTVIFMTEIDMRL